jgi:hypothetical protein
LLTRYLYTLCLIPESSGLDWSWRESHAALSHPPARALGEIRVSCTRVSGAWRSSPPTRGLGGVGRSSNRESHAEFRTLLSRFIHQCQITYERQTSRYLLSHGVYHSTTLITITSIYRRQEDKVVVGLVQEQKKKKGQVSTLAQVAHLCLRATAPGK